jgi:hypothetical protein
MMLERLVSGVAAGSCEEPVPSLRDEFHAVLDAYAILVAVDRMPGASSRGVCGAVGSSERDTLRLLGLLEHLGLLRSTRTLPDAWYLTLRGEEVVHGNRPTGEPLV